MNLNLTLKKKWFDMIASGEKKEEYREIKQYWISRLLLDVTVKDPSISYEQLAELIKAKSEDACYCFMDFDTVTAKNGYAKDAPSVTWEHKGIRIGTGKSEWGAEPDTLYFILDIGNIVSN